MKTINNVCNDCGRLFKSKDAGQLPRCPDCNGRNTRQTTAIEDMELRRHKLYN